MHLKRRYFSLLVATVIIFVFYRFWFGQRRRIDFKTSKFLKFKDVAEISSNSKWPSNANFACSMASCFNWTKCIYSDQPKVYIYSSHFGFSIIYKKILQVISESYMFTSNPEEACLFILAIDTIDRDKLSKSYIMDLNDKIKALPQDVWVNGTNHLIFNLFYGSFPDYGYNLGFDTGKAMIAWASANSQTFRFGFDLSFPLFYKNHSFRTMPEKLEIQSLRKDKYIASFKGKRYVFGIGSETRNNLYKLHDNNSIIIATTCKHSVLWKKFEDHRCALDNKNYNVWDYKNLIKDSTFCLTPRGRRLGSFRFLEALEMGCIPVVLSDDLLLPLFEVIDWSKAVIPWHEKNLLFISDYLLQLPESTIFEMKRQCLLLYHRHFSSVENILISSIESIFERIRKKRVNNFKPINWNSLTNLKIKNTGFTLVFQAISQDFNRLKRVIFEISKLPNINRIILLWPKERGPLPSAKSFNIVIEILFFKIDQEDQSEYLKVDYSSISGDFVLFLDERITINFNKLNSALILSYNNPQKLTVFYASHYECLTNKNQNLACSLIQPSKINYSFGWFHQAIVHKHFIYKYQMEYLQNEIKFNWFTRQCHIVLFNFVFSSWTLNAPIWLTINSSVSLPSWATIRNENICVNKIVHELYADKMPLISSRLHYVLH